MPKLGIRTRFTLILSAIFIIAIVGDVGSFFASASAAG